MKAFESESEQAFVVCVCSSVAFCIYLWLRYPSLVNLFAEATSLGEPSLAAGRGAEHDVARSAKDHGLCVAEDGGDLEASGALDVHEEAIGGLHKSLELVCAGLGLHGGVEQIDRHFYLMRGGVGF